MKWEVTTPPTARLIDYSAVLKRHVRLDDEYDGQADLVHFYIDAATEHAQERLSSSLMLQTITATYWEDDMHRSVIRLPRGPVVEVHSAIGADGEEVHFEQFRIGHSDRLKLGTCAFPLTVVYDAGYESADDVPADIRLAVMTHVATLYEHRESVIDKALVPVPHSLQDFYRLKARSLGVA